MKKLVFLLVFVSMAFVVSAHDIHYQNVHLKQWHIAGEQKPVDGSFTLYRNGLVYIEDEHARVRTFPLKSLSAFDQSYILHRMQSIEQLNQSHSLQHRKSDHAQSTTTQNHLWIFGLMITMAASAVLLVLDKGNRKYVMPIVLAGTTMTLYGFGKKYVATMQFTTNPAFIDSAFVPFKPHVNTFWDTTYFYVESKGIPTTHGMMVGISNHGWQQQVPIPQCYIGTNAWPIPLNPVMAANPIPVDTIHFTRGAIAIAANGVPIFNVHTNTGVDSYLDGQLDNYGGHCGRADDYHYHTAPLHLYAHTTTSLPCAFGLDGFPVYGSVEPDGNSMQALDSNHGHFYNNQYHYHGTPAAPYMIARMAGEVTEDATHQLIPQAAAHPVRPALTPLNGALITACTPNLSNNGYTLVYTRNGQTDSIVYSWNLSGQYTFNFYTAGNGTSTTQNYNGFVQCSVPTGMEDVQQQEPSFSVYPNPNDGFFRVEPGKGILTSDIRRVSVFDLKGVLVYESTSFRQIIDIRKFGQGVYIVRLQLPRSSISQKIIVRD